MSRWALAAGVVAAAAIAVAHRRKRRTPKWWDELLEESSLERLHIAEWENGYLWRRLNGWVGTDYAHGANAAVHIAGYVMGKTDEGHACLVGAVYMAPGAESHKGLCHGGTMCTIMDDVIGWNGFCVSGVCVPWSGFTVQINTTLQAPIKIASWLRVEASITKVERRKVSVKAKLVSPATEGSDEVVHCTGEGLFVVKKESS